MVHLIPRGAATAHNDDNKALRLARKSRRLHAIQDSHQKIYESQEQIKVLKMQIVQWEQWYYGSWYTNELSEVQVEARKRLQIVQPVLEEHIHAASAGRPPRVNGSMRLRRNVAEHVFTKPIDVLSRHAAELKRAQRGTRKKSKTVCENIGDDDANEFFDAHEFLPSSSPSPLDAMRVEIEQVRSNLDAQMTVTIPNALNDDIYKIIDIVSQKIESCPELSQG